MKLIQKLLCGAVVLAAFTSCGTPALNAVYLEAYSPEEGALNLVKITDETNGSVIAGGDNYPIAMTNYALSTQGISQKLAWSTSNTLDVSPDGTQLAYITRMNNQSNVMVRGTGGQGMTTQRTFRNVNSFSWGEDNKIYFSDFTGNNNYICRVHALQGSMMDQLTNGSVVDLNPIPSADGKRVFFTRSSNVNGPSIWSLNLESNTLTSCARGFSPCPIKDNPEAFYCVRNNTNRQSEIWLVNYVKGTESVVLSDRNRSFTHPRVSPDGKWIVCVGNSTSAKTKKENRDIFVVRTDGTRLTQLTYHPATDTNPVWSADGKSIYFISARANKDSYFNIWRMNFNMD